MNNIIRTTLLTTLATVAVMSPSLAAEDSQGKKTKEIKELVGYNVTETTTYEGPKSRLFSRVDANDDGMMSFREYQNYATVDNEYEIFSLMDKDQNKMVSVEEFIDADVTKGSTHVASGMFGKYEVKGTNLKTRPLPETKNYFVPTDREIVDIKHIEPAGN